MKIQKICRPFVLLATVLLSIVALTSPCVAVSSRIRVVDLAPPSLTSISCSVLPASLMLGNSTTVSGSITPAVSNATVTLTYTKPDSNTLTRSATSATDGSYSDTYTPDVAGTWSVTASWAGNDNFFGSTSSAESFTVTNGASSGVPMLYIYLIVVIIIVIAAAIVIYRFTKKK
jgi:cobalamin biosynthesis Mg chelatase CobN